MNTGMSQRERYIAFGVLIAVGLFALNYFIFDPYLARRTAINNQREAVDKQSADAERLFNQRNALKKIWTQIQQSGLKTSRSAAESQAQQAVLSWAQQAGISVVAIKPERDTSQQQFQLISFHVTGTGTMGAITRLLWPIETATIPVRVNDLQITPRKENSDDLSLQLTVSTLSLSNALPTPTGNPLADGGAR